MKINPTIGGSLISGAASFLDYLRIDPTHCTILPISSQMASDSDMQGGTMIATQ